MCCIEFQKRGLPHTHLLIILASLDALGPLDDPQSWDNIVCAELPDQQSQPEVCVWLCAYGLRKLHMCLQTMAMNQDIHYLHVI